MGELSFRARLAIVAFLVVATLVAFMCQRDPASAQTEPNVSVWVSTNANESSIPASAVSGFPHVTLSCSADGYIYVGQTSTASAIEEIRLGGSDFTYTFDLTTPNGADGNNTWWRTVLPQTCSLINGESVTVLRVPSTTMTSVYAWSSTDATQSGIPDDAQSGWPTVPITCATDGYFYIGQARTARTIEEVRLEGSDYSYAFHLAAPSGDDGTNVWWRTTTTQQCSLLNGKRWTVERYRVDEVMTPVYAWSSANPAQASIPLDAQNGWPTIPVRCTADGYFYIGQASTATAIEEIRLRGADFTYAFNLAAVSGSDAANVWWRTTTPHQCDLLNGEQWFVQRDAVRAVPTPVATAQVPGFSAREVELEPTSVSFRNFTGTDQSKFWLSTCTDFATCLADVDFNTGVYAVGNATYADWLMVTDFDPVQFGNGTYGGPFRQRIDLTVPYLDNFQFTVLGGELRSSRVVPLSGGDVEEFSFTNPTIHPEEIKPRVSATSVQSVYIQWADAAPTGTYTDDPERTFKTVIQFRFERKTEAFPTFTIAGSALLFPCESCIVKRMVRSAPPVVQIPSVEEGASLFETGNTDVISGLQTGGDATIIGGTEIGDAAQTAGFDPRWIFVSLAFIGFFVASVGLYAITKSMLIGGIAGGVVIAISGPALLGLLETGGLLFAYGILVLAIAQVGGKSGDDG